MLKSINKHRTYELSSRSLVTWCMKKVKAQVVLPVGLNANWSAITVASIARKSQFLYIAVKSVFPAYKSSLYRPAAKNRK